MIKRNYIFSIVFFVLIGTISFDLYCINVTNDISKVLDLESDDNGDDHNQAIPNLGGQMPESPNAFDSFDQKDTMNSALNGAQDDLDVSISINVEKSRSRHDSPLMIEVLKNNGSLVRHLLKNNNNDVNYKNKDGQTALHDAAQRDFTHLVKLLLKHGAQVDNQDNLGRTALHVAAQNDSVATANLLMLYGADPKLKDNDDKVAADYAVSSEMKELVSL